MVRVVEYQTRIGYYAELFVYPIVVGGLLLYDIDGSGVALHSGWWFAAACGAMFWTLAEYLVHRFVYHKGPILRDLHGMHHSRRCDFIGAPIWVSAVSFCSFFFLLALLCDVQIASGTTSGLIVGYVSYLLIHDAVHRWQLDEKSWAAQPQASASSSSSSPSAGQLRRDDGGLGSGIWYCDYARASAPGPRNVGIISFRSEPHSPHRWRIATNLVGRADVSCRRQSRPHLRWTRSASGHEATLKPSPDDGGRKR